MIQYAIPILEFDDNPRRSYANLHEGLDFKVAKSASMRFGGKRLTTMLRK